MQIKTRHYSLSPYLVNSIIEVLNTNQKLNNLELSRTNNKFVLIYKPAKEVYDHDTSHYDHDSTTRFTI